MPVTIPTLFAMRYVAENSLVNRINVLQKSYKFQYMMFGSLLSLNTTFENQNIFKLIELNFLN